MAGRADTAAAEKRRADARNFIANERSERGGRGEGKEEGRKWLEGGGRAGGWSRSRQSPSLPDEELRAAGNLVSLIFLTLSTWESEAVSSPSKKSQ